jgi:CBS domain containing-hemolysin-like protein
MDPADAENSIMIIKLIILIALLFLSAFFSSAETAFISADKFAIRQLIQEGNRKAKRVAKILEDKDAMISAILIGNNIVNITATSISMLFFAKIITGGIDYSIVSTIVMTVTVLIFGEITPKYIAKAYPEKFALLFYPLIMLFYYVLYPLNLVFGGFKTVIGWLFRIEHDDTITDEELLTIVNEAEEDGTLKEEESNLIKSAIEFDDLEVKDILVPRINMVAIPSDLEVKEIKKVFEKERYSRLPVYKDNIDSVIGFIHEKDFYRVYDKKDFDVKNIMQEVIFVVEHTKISALLKKLQKNKVHMAIVLDEYGGTLGIVTVEDIIEELVGEIYDEHDEEFEPFKENADGSVTVNCLTELDDFFEKFEIFEDEDEECDANTVGGWVNEKLGELPTTGKKFSYQNLDVTVSKTTKKKALEIKVIVNEKTEDEDEE